MRRPRAAWLLAAGIAAALHALVTPGMASAPGEDAPGMVRLPPDWRELPDIASQAAGAVSAAWPGTRVRARAAGEPSAGCFLLIIELEVEGADARVHQALRKAVAARGVTVSEWRSERQGQRVASSFNVASPVIRGAVRVHSAPAASGSLRVRSAACFYTDREPVSSAHRCDALLNELEEDQ